MDAYSQGCTTQTTESLQETSVKPDLLTLEKMLLRWGENCLFHCTRAYRTAQEQHNKHQHRRNTTTHHRVNKKEYEVEKNEIYIEAS